MLDLISEPSLAMLIGLGGGIVLGLAARIGRFCTLGAIEDALYGAKTDRLAMWGVAIGVAIIGTQYLISTDLLDPNSTAYTAMGANIAGAILGGLAFGYGMALCGNCGYGALARLGGGDLRSAMIVLMMGLGAYVALSGPLARLRLTLFGAPQVDAIHSGPTNGFAAVLPLSDAAVGIVLGLAVLAYALWHLRGTDNRPAIIWGTAVGLSVVSGWLGTYWLSHTGFDALPVASHTFAAPVGETMLFAMTSSGSSLSFGIGSVAGVLAGAFAGSLFKGHFRWEACDDPRELKRQMLGAFIMGIGAVVATGCSIGQGVTGMSLLTWTAPLTLASIFIGSAIGLKVLINGYERI